MDDAEAKNGWLFPEGVPLPEDEAWFRMKFGETTIHGWSWRGHVHQLHAADVDFESIRTHIVDSGQTEGGILYAAAKTTIALDGTVFSAVSGADETSQQVNDPEHVWSVAESRSVKRAVQKALDIRPTDQETMAANDEEMKASQRDDGPAHVPEATRDPPSSPQASGSVGSEDIDF